MEVTDEAIDAAVQWYFDERGSRDRGLTKEQWRTITRQLRDVLEREAPRPKGLLFYRGLVDQTDLGEYQAWNLLVPEFLLLLVKACADAQLPMPTALVYGRARNEPGPSFYKAAVHFGLIAEGQSEEGSGSARSRPCRCIGAVPPSDDAAPGFRQVAV